jgi:hypothetical protein
MECKKLDAWLRSSSENEGGIVLEAGEEGSTLAAADPPMRPTLAP